MTSEEWSRTENEILRDRVRELMDVLVQVRLEITQLSASDEALDVPLIVGNVLAILEENGVTAEDVERLKLSE